MSIKKKVVTIANSKGGVGKSTVAVNFAIDMANKGYNVILCDAEKGGSLQEYDEIERDNLTILNAYDKTFPKMLDIYRNQFDLVVIDLAGTGADLEGDGDNFQETINHKIISKTDHLIIPVEPTPVAVRKTLRFLDTIDNYIDASRGALTATVYINKGKKGTKQTREVQNNLSKYLNVPVSKVMLRVLEDYRHAEGEYKSVNEYAPNGDAAFDFRHLTKEVLKNIGMGA